MNIKSIAYTLFALVALSSCSYKEPNSLEGMGFKGKVKSVCTNTYNARMKFGEITKQDLIEDYIYVVKYVPAKEILKFSKDGYLTSVASYNNDGELNYRSVMEWENGRQTNYRHYSDESNKPSDNHRFVDEYKDSQIITNIYDKDGLLDGRIVKKLDKKGRPVELTNYDKDGDMVYREVREFNNKNKITHVKQYYGETDKPIDIECSYKGKIQTSIRIKQPGATDYTEELFNKYGHMVSYKSSEKSPEYTFEYIYDKNDNWTTCYIYEDGKIKYVQERDIVYY